MLHEGILNGERSPEVSFVSFHYQALFAQIIP